MQSKNAVPRARHYRCLLRGDNLPITPLMPIPDFPSDIHVLERGWVSSNNILCLGQDHIAVIDTGYVHHAVQTVSLIRHVLGERSPDTIINTHVHSDHIGGNARLQETFPEITIQVPSGSWSDVDSWDVDALHLGPMGQECDPFRPTGRYSANDRLSLGGYEWHSFSSPGHDDDSLMLFCPERRILISADALWENGFGVLFPSFDPVLGFEDAALRAIANQRKTLEFIADLRPSPLWVIPGHGGIFTDLAGALQRAFKRLDYFLSSPLQQARYALKVSLSFVLMVEGRIELSSLVVRLSRMDFVQSLNQHFFKMSPEDLANYLVVELEKSRAARRQGDWLVST